jgi:hypothetical protein
MNPWDYAVEDFHWNSIGPGETVGVFIHPYGLNEFTSFCITVTLNSNEPTGAYQTIAAQMTDGLTSYFEGKVARTIWVQNKTVGPQPYIGVSLMRFTQSV